MRESIKHIYKKMLLKLTCSQMFVCFFNQIPAPQMMMNPDDFLQTQNQGSRVQGSCLFVTYTIIQGIISSEM